MRDIERQTQRPPYLVESVEKALRILLMMRSEGEVRVSQVSDELEIARSTAHRLLSTLAYVGFLRHDPVRHVYVSGGELVEIALASTGHRVLRRVAMPHLKKLSKEIEWTVHLSVLEGADIRFVDCAESPRPVRVTARVGSRFPAHSTSSGKVLLAELPTKHLDRLYRNGLAPVTENTITRLEDLLSELRTVREQEYASNRGENEVGLTAVSVPIRTGKGSVIAAIAAARPTFAADQVDFSKVLEALHATAGKVGADMDSLEGLSMQ